MKLCLLMQTYVKGKTINLNPFKCQMLLLKFAVKLS